MFASRVGLVLLGLMVLAAGPLAAQAQTQSPYSPTPDQQQLPPPTSPYPGGQGPSSPGQGPGAPGQGPGTGYPPGYQHPSQQQAPQQQQTPPAPRPGPGRRQQQPPPPAGGGQGGLTDLLGRFRLGPVPGLQPTGATYSFAMPGQGVQVSLMSLAHEQAFQMQQQNFPNTISQMGGRITEQRQVDLGGRQALLMVAVASSPQTGGQMMSYNLFIPGANLWLQVMGDAQARDRIQQVTNQILQNLSVR